MLKASVLPTIWKEKASNYPLLRIVSQAFPLVILNDVYVLCAQHLVETSVSLFYTLFQLGLDPSHFSVIGKCYSTNPSVYHELRNIQRLDICESSRQFFPNQSFDEQYKENVRTFFSGRLERILASGCRRLIIVDDGGELIDIANQYVKNSIFPENIEIVGIEQTSSGFTKLQSIDLVFPVVNVARSSVKLQLEAYLIADAIFTNLQIALKNIDVYPKKVLILGTGAIGSKVEEKLKAYYQVDTYDPLVSASSLRDFHVTHLSRYDLIVGCSGTEVLHPSNFHFLKKGAILASASSSDREFCALEFRMQIDHPIRCHEDVFLNGIYLLNCGFPINFSRQYHLVDGEMYQLTRSLLLTGILQGCSQEIASPSFIDLSHSIQNIIRQEFFSLYPDFVKKHLFSVSSKLKNHVEDVNISALSCQ